MTPFLLRSSAASNFYAPILRVHLAGVSLVRMAWLLHVYIRAIGRLIGSARAKSGGHIFSLAELEVAVRVLMVISAKH
mgnify:CR=1 FL=1